MIHHKMNYLIIKLRITYCDSEIIASFNIVVEDDLCILLFIAASFMFMLYQSFTFFILHNQNIMKRGQYMLIF